MKKLFLLLFLAGTNIAFSQHNINGTVLDAQTQMPVIGAAIFIPKLDKGTVTDLDGKFTLENLPQGSFDFVTSSLGFASSTRTIEVHYY